jgi:hypothetical protein
MGWTCSVNLSWTVAFQKMDSSKRSQRRCQIGFGLLMSGSDVVWTSPCPRQCSQIDSQKNKTRTALLRGASF